MNKFLSLLLCLSLVVPVNAMDLHLVTEESAPKPSMAHRLANTISCKKVILTAFCLAALSILSTGGYFITSTCIKMQNGCSTLETGCAEMKSACNNCTTNFAQANCGLKLVDSVATLIEQLVKKYPQVALDLALELSHLNKSLNCH